MEEKSLKIIGADKTFFGRLTNTISKIIMPTKLGLNSLIISMKRNAMLKAYYNLYEISENTDKEETLTKKYDTAYASYLEAIDKYIMDSVYKKVKNKTANQFEENALSKYYNIINLKENHYTEYKYRKQKYLIDLDYSGLEAGKKDKLFVKYKKFYYKTMEGLYKGILKNYSVQLANSGNVPESEKDVIYKKIFNTIEDYLDNVLPVKIECEPEIDKEIIDQYDNYQNFQAGKLDKKDTIEKNMIILGLSRKLFTHSLPLVVAEQCYVKLIKDIRDLIITSPNKKKEDIAYEMLINLIEEFNIKLLSTKIYWDNTDERQNFKDFWDKYKALDKNDNYAAKKQVLFVKHELNDLKQDKQKNERIIKFYKTKLVELGAGKEVKGFKTLATRLMKPKAYQKFVASKNEKIQEQETEDTTVTPTKTIAETIKESIVQTEVATEQTNTEVIETVVEPEVKPKRRGRPRKVKVAEE